MNEQALAKAIVLIGTVLGVDLAVDIVALILELT